MSSTVSHSKRTGCWKMTLASPLRIASAAGRPQTSTCPALGGLRPARRNSTVVFPHPEGPMMETNSPALTSSVKSETAWRAVSSRPPPAGPGRATS